MTDPTSNWATNPGMETTTISNAIGTSERTTNATPAYTSTTGTTNVTSTRSSSDEDPPSYLGMNANNNNNNNMNDNEAYSPFLNNLLRFSPKQHPSSMIGGNTSSIYQASPLHYRRPTTTTNSTPAAAAAAAAAAADATVLKNPLLPQSTRTNSNSNTVVMTNDTNTNTQHEDHHSLQDGIPIHHLRTLVQSSLLLSPSIASYYANIIYCKTQSLQDAYILAQAHYFNHKYDTCLRIIEESQLLQLQHYYDHQNVDDSLNHIRIAAANTTTTNDTPPPEATTKVAFLLLFWDTVLVAAQALIAKRDYTTLIDLLEDSCRLPNPTTTTTTTTIPDPIITTTTTTTDHYDDPLTQQMQQLPLEDNDSIGWMTLKRVITSSSSSSSTAMTDTKLHPLSLVCYYRGLGYYETGCTIRAATFWKWALIMDSYNQTAWHSLLENHLLTNTEAYEFLMNDERLILNHPEQGWIKSLYLSRIEFNTATTTNATIHPDFKSNAGTSGTTQTVVGMSKSLPQGNTSLDVSSIHFSALSPIPTFHVPDTEISTVMEQSTTNDDDNNEHDQQQKHMNTITESLRTTMIQNDIDQAFYNLFHVYKLQNSSQVLAVAARRAYRRYDWKSSLLYCQDLAQLDPTVEEASFYYIATLVMLGHKRVLFRLAHEWVDATPKAARSWFAVGAYYYSIHRYHIAQRHFCRATRMNPQCTEAWIALGCSFAACDESDQALASFRAAQRLSPGEHSSLLYMGMEYIRTNHLVLASHFLQAALSSSGGDPLCLHEMGVLASHKGDHKDAIYYFRQAMSSISGGRESLQENVDLCDNVYWEPTIFNLGHSYRKCRQFNNALICFNRCVTLCPEKYSTYSALAFTKHLVGDIDDAISFYHKALGLKPDDPFCTDMLSRAFHDQIATTTTQDIFYIGLPSTSKNATDPLLLSTPSITIGHRKGDIIIGEDMELDFDMSIAS